MAFADDVRKGGAKATLGLIYGQIHDTLDVLYHAPVGESTVLELLQKQPKHPHAASSALDSFNDKVGVYIENKIHALNTDIDASDELQASKLDLAQSLVELPGIEGQATAYAMIDAADREVNKTLRGMGFDVDELSIAG